MCNLDHMKAAAAYLRGEADFNRSWTDGRRNARPVDNPGYTARRLELAAERDAWADAIEAAVDALLKQREAA